MKQYRMTDEEYKDVMEASQPVPYIVVGGIEPRSSYDRVMPVWRRIAARVGCVVDSIEVAGTGDNHDFMAEPQEEQR
jgi:hypothetical protein